MITLHNDTSISINGDSFEYAYICDLPGGLYYTNHSTDLVVGSNTYSSNGLLMKFSNVSKDHSMKVGSYSLTLSNVATAIANGYMTTSFRGRPAEIKLVLMEDGIIQGDPILLYKGTLDTWGIQETTSTSQIELKLTSHWASYNQNAGRYTNDNSHQQIYSGDDFFKYSHTDLANIGWGK